MHEFRDFTWSSAEGSRLCARAAARSRRSIRCLAPAEAEAGDRGLVPVPSQAARSALGCQRCFSNAASVGVSNIALTSFDITFCATISTTSKAARSAQPAASKAATCSAEGRPRVSTTASAKA